jgi:hypothetical protein
MVDGVTGSMTSDVISMVNGKSIGSGTSLQWAAPSVDLNIFTGVPGKGPVGSVAAYTVSAVDGVDPERRNIGPGGD